MGFASGPCTSYLMFSLRRQDHWVWMQADKVTMQIFDINYCKFCGLWGNKTAFLITNSVKNVKSAESDFFIALIKRPQIKSK